MKSGIGTHDYETKEVIGSKLDNSMVIVGQSGGLCAIYGSPKSGLVQGLSYIDTEYGLLVFDPDELFDVLDMG